jgi:Fe2+ or Zn2+ uptake regulation protein
MEEYKAAKSTWRTALRAKGLKSTPARVAILEASSRAQKPLTVEQIGEKVKKLSLDTVTRTPILGRGSSLKINYGA